MTTADIQAQITAQANAAGVPPSIALAVAKQESGFNQAARGTSGEIGVFQLMPATAAGLGVDPTDLTQNIQGGIDFLAQMFQKFGDWPTALAAYNAGPGNVSRGIIPASTQSYVASVMATSGSFAATGSAAVPAAPPSSADPGAIADTSGFDPIAYLFGEATALPSFSDTTDSGIEASLPPAVWIIGGLFVFWAIGKLFD